MPSDPLGDLGTYIRGALEHVRPTAEGKQNVRAQLQGDEPTILDTLVKGWADWRMQQWPFVETRPDEPPIGAGAMPGLGGVLQKARPDYFRRFYQAAMGPAPRAQMLHEMSRVPVAKEAAQVPASTLWTPGQPTAASLLPGGLYEATQKEALTGYDLTRKRISEAAQEIRDEFKSPSKLRPEFEKGKFGATWYTGTYPELQRTVQTFRQALPPTLARELVKPEDAVLLAKMITATSSSMEPNMNVSWALAAYAEFLATGRDPKKTIGLMEKYFASGITQDAHIKNLAHAVSGEPLSGPKYANYLLNQLGSESNTTVDRWAANAILGKPSTKADLTATEYAVASQRFQQLSERWGVPPARVQAAMWTGTKLLRDEKMKSLLDRTFTMAKTGQTWTLTGPEIIPPLREVIRDKAERLAAAWRVDPTMLAPVALGALLLEQAGEKAPD